MGGEKLVVDCSSVRCWMFIGETKNVPIVCWVFVMDTKFKKFDLGDRLIDFSISVTG